MYNNATPVQQQYSVHRQPMTTWNPPVYNSNPTVHQETMQWSNNSPQVFKQESFKVEPQEQYAQHSNENFPQRQSQQQAASHVNQDQEFQHLFSPLKYLSDFDGDQQYQGLGVAPLPLHGQVRPIKVEQEQDPGLWSGHQTVNDENHPSNLSSTPPILRRRNRKREAEDDKLDQFLRSPGNMSFDMTGSLTSTPTHAPGLAASGAAGYPPTAQSTPVTSFHRMSVAGGGQASLLTTPNLSTNDDQVSAHSTPKMSKLSPTSSKERGETPRTPTPFKRALARAREPLSNTPQTPTKRLEDINDIIKKDMLDISHSSTPNFYQTLQDSGYGTTDKRPVSGARAEEYDCGDKENSSPNRKVSASGARRALATKYSSSAALPNMMFGGATTTP